VHVGQSKPSKTLSAKSTSPCLKIHFKVDACGLCAAKHGPRIPPRAAPALHRHPPASPVRPALAQPAQPNDPQNPNAPLPRPAPPRRARPAAAQPAGGTAPSSRPGNRAPVAPRARAHRRHRRAAQAALPAAHGVGSARGGEDWRERAGLKNCCCWAGASKRASGPPSRAARPCPRRARPS
jgi:hypothetical protein